MSTAPYPPPPPVPPSPYQQPQQPGVYSAQQSVPAGLPGYTYYLPPQQQQPDITQSPAAADRPSFVPHIVLAASGCICSIIFGFCLCVFAPFAIIFAGKSIRLSCYHSSWLSVFTARCYAERGYADSKSSVCLSLRLSVTLMYDFHIGWNSSKIILRPNSLRSMRSLTPNIGDLVQREHPKN